VNSIFAEVYDSTEHLATDEVNVKCMGKLIFSQFIPKQTKRFGRKLYKLCDSLAHTMTQRCTYGSNAKMRLAMTLQHTILSCRQRTRATSCIWTTTTQPIVELCGSVRRNRREVHSNFGRKYLKLKKMRYCIQGVLKSNAHVLEGPAHTFAGMWCSTLYFVGQ
jgi:hypothetical protein